MPLRTPVDLGSRYFSSGKETAQHFKEILWAHEPGDYVVDPQSTLDLRALLNRHPEVEQKVGVGLKNFFVDKDGWGGQCFWLERFDGSKTDFSFRSCIKGQPQSVYKEFTNACRHAVRKDSRKAKEMFFKKYGNEAGQVKCELTGKMISIKEAHVDHIPPLTFEVIVETFVKANDIVPHHNMLSKKEDAQFTSTFVDMELQKNFQSYHQATAKLRILAAKPNLRVGPQHRIREAQRPIIIGGEHCENTE